MNRIQLGVAVVIFSVLGCTGGGGATNTSSSTLPATTAGTSTTSTTSSTPPATQPPPPATPPAPPASNPSSSGGTGGIGGVVPGTPSFGLIYKLGDANSLYDIYIPKGYTGAPTGLVLAFHGVEGTSTPDGWFQLCALICNNDRFIVVAPYGDVNDGGSGAWTQPYGREIMDLVRSKYNVDDKRQYMAAISGGCLPGIFFALTSAPATYASTVGGFPTKSGYQADFAAVGFCAPAYSPSFPDFAGTTSLTAAQLGFTPALWADYGSLSQNGPQADDLAAFGTSHGYSPVKEVVRPGEGHPPDPPYTYEVQMFDMFAATKKP
jgi:hypothetical protein